MVDELGKALPNDLLEANEIIRQRDSIFSLANLEAQRIKNSADEYAAASRASAEEESRARVRRTASITEIFDRIYPVLASTHVTEVYEETG